MIEYPSISAEIRRGIPIIAFQKLDGSAVRAEWSAKKKLHKFGTRHRLLGEDEKPVGESIGLILGKYDEALYNILRKNRTEKAVCFFEFYGPNSAFGQHQQEKHTVTLLDVYIDKQGIIPPREFLKLTRGIEIPEVLYEGNCNSDFEQSIREGTCPGLGSEGVVCKGQLDRKTGIPIMFKVKRNDWYERLRKHCGDNEQLFKELS